MTKMKRISDYVDALQDHLAITGLGGVLLGFLSGVLLSETVMIPRTVTEVFLGGLALIVVVWLFTRKRRKGDFDRPRWGTLSVLLIGYGFGAFLYVYRQGIEWVWLRLQTIDSTPKVLLAALFLFGLIMGFFVVRNWSKEQEDFTKSIVAAGGGALLTSLLGKLTDKTDTFQAFVFYFLGFSISGAVNLIAAALLTAAYSNKKSIASRTVLSFLYGSDKAEAVDKQFLKNFEEDPIYPRRLLINTVLKYEKKVLKEFANKREQKRQTQGPALTYYQLIAIQCEKPAVSAPAAEEPPPPVQGQPAPAAVVSAQDAQLSSSTEMTVLFREITEPLSEKMFRSAVSCKWQDNLEFIDAAAGYTKSFPYFGSVAGLALEVLHTIVMDRDKYKRFRTTQYPRGLCPASIEQARGLDEIDYLSYVSVPVASNIGQPEQTRLGVLHIDTKLFAGPRQVLNPNNNTGVLTAKLRPADLTEYANNLYDQDQDDVGVKYLEDMRAVLVPVLQLYLKCRQGSA